MILIKRLIRVYISSLLILSGFNAYAQTPYFTGGPVFDIDNQYINVNDRQYPISPTVKIFSSDNKVISLSDIALRDLVSLRFIYLNNQKMVDEIHKIDALNEAEGRLEE
jgi:hypothetical protein